MGNVPISFGDLEKLAKKGTSEKPVKKSSTKKRSRAKVRPAVADKDVSNRETSPVNPEAVYQVLHYYTRPNDTFSAVKRDARQEVELRNINVRVIVHDHSYSGLCDSGNCTVITRDSEESSD